MPPYTTILSFPNGKIFVRMQKVYFYVNRTHDFKITLPFTTTEVAVCLHRASCRLEFFGRTFLTSNDGNSSELEDDE